MNYEKNLHLGFVYIYRENIGLCLLLFLVVFMFLYADWENFNLNPQLVSKICEKLLFFLQYETFTKY